MWIAQLSASGDGFIHLYDVIKEEKDQCEAEKQSSTPVRLIQEKRGHLSFLHLFVPQINDLIPCMLSIRDRKH